MKRTLRSCRPDRSSFRPFRSRTTNGPEGPRVGALRSATVEPVWSGARGVDLPDLHRSIGGRLWSGVCGPVDPPPALAVMGADLLGMGVTGGRCCHGGLRGQVGRPFPGRGVSIGSRPASQGRAARGRAQRLACVRAWSAPGEGRAAVSRHSVAGGSGRPEVDFDSRASQWRSPLRVINSRKL